jgi:nitroreductase
MTLSAVEVCKVKAAPHVEGVLPVFHERWSPRSFADRDVSGADLKKVFEAARWMASSFNEQPWRYFAGTRNSSTYRKILSSLTEFNQAWAQTAPVLILGVAGTRFSHNNAPNRVALYDLGAASACLTLQATALGLLTHQMAGVDEAAARAAFAIPEDFVLGAAIALGYQGEPGALSVEQMIAQETAPRTRKPLSEFVWSSWNEAADLG